MQDTSVQTGVLQALDTWLAEDLARVEGKLTQRDAVAALVDLYARSHQAQETQVIDANSWSIGEDVGDLEGLPCQEGRPGREIRMAGAFSDFVYLLNNPPRSRCA